MKLAFTLAAAAALVAACAQHTAEYPGTVQRMFAFNCGESVTN